MPSETHNLEKKLIKFSEKIVELEKRVLSLESQLETKNIIIEALAEKLKYTESSKKQHLELEPSNKRYKQKKQVEYLPGIEMHLTDSSTTETEVFLKSPLQANQVVDELEGLVSKIKAIFTPKSKNVDFKMNYNFRKFVEYAEASYEFSLFNKKVVKQKNPIKQYLEFNIDRIIKFILENINTLNMNQICSTIFLITSEICYKQKLIFFHDIILELKDYLKLNFIAAALFNNLELESGLFSQVLKKIIYHQMCINCDIFKDLEILGYLGVIRDNFALVPPDISLWDSLSHFLIKHNLFENTPKTVREESIENGFILRMLCQFLDWDYTYNTFILKQLYPLILSEKCAIHVYYIGILMLNAKREFGDDISILSLEEELKTIIEWNEECSIAAYLILKQVRERDAESWLEKNSELVKSFGFQLSYLKSLLLI
ncbi:hypothetical protein GINT2_001877 [Glugoides intestinalis]